jgi:hypothetical protein
LGVQRTLAANPFDATANNDLTFTLNFTVSDPSTATIANGFWTIDDGGTLSLNGVTLSSLSPGDWASLHPFSTVPAEFVAGLNVLTIQEVNSDALVGGARLEGEIVGGGTVTLAALAPPAIGSGSGIPETSTWTMMLAGFAGLGYAALRRSSSKWAAPSRA